MKDEIPRPGNFWEFEMTNLIELTEEGIEELLGRSSEKERALIIKNLGEMSESAESLVDAAAKFLEEED